MTRIKICGLRRPEDITYVNACRPDYIGFVFAKSRRQVTKGQAMALRTLLDEGITPVGVFVNEEPEKIAELVREGIIEIIQLHGDEDNEYIRNLRKLVPYTVIIRAVRVAGREDIIRSREISADYLLFDTFSAKEYGGTGESFDWSLVEKVGRPFFLAGGINSENVEEALSKCDAFAVDVSSAVETDGFKDEEKIRRMVDKVRNL